MPRFTRHIFLIVLAGWLIFCGFADDVPAGGVFRVEVPEGDAGPALRQAIGQAIQAGPGSEVRLGPGRFTVLPPGKEKFCLAVGGAKGLVIRGEPGKTELILRDPSSMLFHVSGSEDVWLKDMVIDYDPPPFTQGRIEAVDLAAGSFDLAVEAGYPSPGEPWFQVEPPYRQWGLIFDAREKRLKAGASDHLFLKTWEPVRERIWRFHPPTEESDKLRAMQPGDRFALLARGTLGVAFFGNCRQSGIERLTVHASPSLTVALIGCEGMTIRALTIQPCPGSSRLLASDGDGIHCQRNRHGPLIENCHFEALADDGVNIYAPPSILRQTLAPDRILTDAGADIRPGDLLQILDPRAGRIRAEVKAAAVRPTSGSLEVTLERGVERLQAGSTHRDADTIYNLDACGQGYLIRHNHLRLHRRHGLLLRAGGGVVEDNTFEENGGFGIVVGNEPEWPEGPVASNVVLRGNRFTGGGYCAGYIDSPIAASIMIRAARLGGLAEDRLHRRIRVEGNRFIDPPGAAIYLGAAQDADLIENRMEGTVSKPLRSHSSGIILDHCAGVRINGFEIKDARPERDAAVHILPSVASGAAGVSISGIKASLAAGGVPIRDERPAQTVTTEPRSASSTGRRSPCPDHSTGCRLH